MTPQTSSRPALAEAVRLMFEAETNYYHQVRTNPDRGASYTAMALHERASKAAAKAVPTNAEGQPIHTCGHAIYAYNSPKLIALDGMDPCRECADRAIIDPLTGVEVIVHRYRIIGTTMIEHAALIPMAALNNGNNWHGPRCSTTHSLPSGSHGDMRTYFNDWAFEALAPMTRERSDRVSRFQRLAEAHAASLIRTAWAEDFATA